MRELSGTPGDLAGRSALVTGATSGIGAACARILAAAGAEVFVVARGREALSRVADEIGGHAVPGDLADDHQVAAMAAEVSARLGDAPDIVVHAAGVFSLAPLHQTAVEDLDRVVAEHRARGYRFLTDEPFTNFMGYRLIYFDPADTGGCRVHLTDAATLR